MEIQTERVSESTKEKYTATSKLLLLAADVKRIGEHPADESKSLLQTNDGANFVVKTPYKKLKASLIGLN